jgi:peptidoglycan hydrolase-like protein with peptidoglycan-binding domain
MNERTRTRTEPRALVASLFTLALFGAACAEPADPDPGDAGLSEPGAGPVGEVDPDGPEPEGDTENEVSEATAAGTVADAVNGGCSTTSVFGISKQIVAESNCIVPGALAVVPDRPDFKKSAATFAFMQTPARNALVKMLDADSRVFSVNSMLRTVAQQYLLREWFEQGKCGIQAAALPGKSNHETGLALDTSDFSAFRTALESKGFKWFGSGDQVHFDYVGSGIKNLTGTDVRAFQRLWNLNHPNDKITVDGLYGPQTESRLRQSPAAGFSKGSTCG